MQSQQMDFKKSYGVVYGHKEAQYEQDGVLFDGVGSPIYAGPLPPTPKNEPVGENSAEVVFLETLLAGGPMLQSTVKKESEIAGLNWTTLNDASIFMNIQKIKQGVNNVWKLDGERA